MLGLVGTFDERCSRSGSHDGPYMRRNKVHRNSTPSAGRLVRGGWVNRVGFMDLKLSSMQRHVFVTRVLVLFLFCFVFVFDIGGRWFDQAITCWLLRLRVI